MAARRLRDRDCSRKTRAKESTWVDSSRVVRADNGGAKSQIKPSTKTGKGSKDGAGAQETEGTTERTSRRDAKQRNKSTRSNL